MKLISKYKDYYDFWARDRRFSDPSYKWERKPSAVKIDFSIPSVITGGSQVMRRGSRWDWRRDIETSCFIVWFCGMPITAARVERYVDPANIDSDRKVDFYYRFEDIPEDVTGQKPRIPSQFGASMYEQLEQMFAFGNIDGLKIKSYSHRLGQEAFSGRKYPAIPVVEMHRRLGTPVFCHAHGIPEYKELTVGVERNRLMVMTAPHVIVNPQLSLIRFFDKVDAFEAFKQLEAFLANQLAPRDVRMDLPIPDVLKAQAHGFDKMSFRREPRKGKRK